MNAIPASATQQLQELRDRFREQLPARVQALETGLHELVRGVWTTAAAVRLRQLAHNLNGSAGTFGFSGVSSAARALETSLDGLLELSATPPIAQLQELSNLFLTLQRIVLTDEQQALAALPERVSGARGLIYMVDDDPDFALETSLQLGNFGYKVKTFSGLEALAAALKQQRPAAVLFDIMFDGQLRGTTYAQQLGDSWSESAPLVFLSTREDFSARLGAVRAGCSGYFTKPVDIGALVDCLDRLTHVRPEEPYRILIVDDSQLDASAYAITLQHAGFQATVITDPASVMAQLSEIMPDLILMDVNMPECSGVELASVIRQLGAYLGTPIVFLSAETDRDLQLSAMKQGGDDFLMKPIQPAHLVDAVRTRAGRGRTLCSLMVHDSLTGLLNHNRIKEQLVAEVARADRYGTDLSVAMIDIDHFKNVNDTYGHPAGDRVIKSLSRLLQQRLRTTDAIGRYGGEEFVAILIGAPAAQARQILEDVRESFSTVRHHALAGEFTTTFSCGIASFPECRNLSQLLDAADQALYAAKKAGRNRVVVAGELSSIARPARTPVARPAADVLHGTAA